MLANKTIKNPIYKRLNFLSFNICFNVNIYFLFSVSNFFAHLLNCIFIKLADIIKQIAKILARIQLDIFITLLIKMIKKFITKNDIVDRARIMFMIKNIFPMGVL